MSTNAHPYLRLVAASLLACSCESPNEAVDVAHTNLISDDVDLMGAYPGVVLVYDGAAGRAELCSGLLISPQHVLTAAHCMDGFTGGEFSVCFGVNAAEFNDVADGTCCSAHAPSS